MLLERNLRDMSLRSWEVVTNGVSHMKQEFLLLAVFAFYLAEVSQSCAISPALSNSGTPCFRGYGERNGGGGNLFIGCIVSPRSICSEILVIVKKG
ncbi:hypothetical protein HPP92_005819 [Vanilla planifolia]|uniref:Uncharacterized protein n=1 Tax=Vanilla planifolia TaxID=51239 RepID=A0A835RPC8_VANPL|nr:hypothetical protein HPP92_005819 [Vanilla planifolia]